MINTYRYGTFDAPVPIVAPMGFPLDDPDMVQGVWDTFVKPSQDAGEPQSIEMRMLMAILRSVHEGLVQHTTSIKILGDSDA